MNPNGSDSAEAERLEAAQEKAAAKARQTVERSTGEASAEARRMQAEVGEARGGLTDGALAEARLRRLDQLSEGGHRVPATVMEKVDTAYDEAQARRIAAHEYPHRSVEALPERNLKGVVYEGMTQRALEDEHGAEHVIPHPEGLTLQDGRRIEPDFAISGPDGRPIELVDAKAYDRKPVERVEPAASSVTHMQGLEKAARYVEVDAQGVEQVTFTMPQETAHVATVEAAVGELGRAERPVAVEAVGSEAEIRQRMEDLRSGEAGLSPKIVERLTEIQDLPVGERRQAVADLVETLKDGHGRETAAGRDLRWNTRIERGGDGITVINPADAKAYTIWYREV